MSESSSFTNPQLALETFRRGKGGRRWEEAAEYLLRNARPDTRMLVDYALQKALTGRAIPKPARRGGPWLIVLGAVALLTTALVTGLAVYALLAARCG